MSLVILFMCLFPASFTVLFVIAINLNLSFDVSLLSSLNNKKYDASLIFINLKMLWKILLITYYFILLW